MRRDTQQFYREITEVDTQMGPSGVKSDFQQFHNATFMLPSSLNQDFTLEKRREEQVVCLQFGAQP